MPCRRSRRGRQADRQEVSRLRSTPLDRRPRPQAQLPPSTTVMNAPSPHARRQVESGAHDSEHESVQRMSQVAPPEHETLPLAPSVIAQVEPPEHVMLQDSPQVPLHSLSMVHASVQLSPAQPEPARSQAVPASHEHELPVQVGGGVSPPHALARNTPSRSMRMVARWCTPRTNAVRQQLHEVLEHAPVKVRQPGAPPDRIVAADSGGQVRRTATSSSGAPAVCAAAGAVRAGSRRGRRRR